MFTPPEPDMAMGLGIRAVSWHPSGGLLAPGGWDDKVRVPESFVVRRGIERRRVFG